MTFTMPARAGDRTVRACLVATLAIGLLGTAAVRLGAQEIKPGPEHALLKEWEGTWDAVIKAGDSESKGAQTASVGLNGLWLLEQFKGEVGGMVFEGRGATSYDPAKKKYVNIWIDSMSTSPMISEGTYDKGTKTLSLAGSMPMPDGTMMKMTIVTVTRDPNTRHFTLKGTGPDGKDMEMVQITYTRRTK